MAYGQPATIPTIQVMAGHDIDVTSHESKPVTGKLIEEASLVLTMTGEHSRILTSTYPGHRRKIFALGDLVASLRAEKRLPDDGGSAAADNDIADPYGGTTQDYEFTSEIISGYVDELISAIKKGQVEI